MYLGYLIYQFLNGTILSRECFILIMMAKFFVRSLEVDIPSKKAYRFRALAISK